MTSHLSLTSTLLHEASIFRDPPVTAVLPKTMAVGESGQHKNFTLRNGAFSDGYYPNGIRFNYLEVIMSHQGEEET
jgi:hypothetical protein